MLLLVYQIQYILFQTTNTTYNKDKYNAGEIKYGLTITTTGFHAEYLLQDKITIARFSTNFSVTKTALEAARDEITRLQSDTAKLNAENDFNGSIIKEAELKEYRNSPCIRKRYCKPKT